jgi:hypothetical protein
VYRVPPAPLPATRQHLGWVLASGRALVRFGIEKLAGGRRMSSVGVLPGGGCILNLHVTLSAAVYGNLSSASTTAGGATCSASTTAGGATCSASTTAGGATCTASQATADACCASATATCDLDPTCGGLCFPHVASTERCTTAADQGATKAETPMRSLMRSLQRGVTTAGGLCLTAGGWCLPDVTSTESCTTAADQGATKAETPWPFSPSHQVFRTLRPRNFLCLGPKRIFLCFSRSLSLPPLTLSLPT